MEQIALQWEPIRRTYSVGELNAAIKATLSYSYGDVEVAGELSNVRQATSGHWYFTLKDESGQLKCALFRNSARLIRFRPQDGLAVVARGKIDVFEARGEYQLLVDTMRPDGDGALQVAFDQLKRKLQAEGLFDAARKRPLPRFPQRIGIVTSPTGAVIRDILHVLDRRHPGLHIRLYPAQVQGAGAIEAVCAAIEHFHISQWAELVIVARGGGSLEDLWTFNEELVARAIAGCSVPVISAIGHETDFTIADFVADLRAPTPSAAAELVICTKQELLEGLAQKRAAMAQALRYRTATLQQRLQRASAERTSLALHRRIGNLDQRVDLLDERLMTSLRRQLTQRRKRTEAVVTNLQRQDLRIRLAKDRARWAACHIALERAAEMLLVQKRCHVDPIAAKLKQLSPYAVLDRGYALVQRPDGSLIKTPADAPPGTALRVRVAGGSFTAERT